MSHENVVSEYFRIYKNTNSSLTMDTVLKMSPTQLTSALKLSRDKLKTQHSNSLTQFFLTAATDDATIAKLNVAQCIFALTNYCESRNIIPDDKYMRNLTKHQLIIEVTKARDVLNGKTVHIQNNAATDAGNKTTTQKSKSTKPRPTKRDLAQNLFGVNTDDLDPDDDEAKKSDPRAPPKPLKDDDDNGQGHKATSNTREVHTIHARLEVGTSAVNIPSKIKSLIIQIRKGDPLVQIVPVLSKTAKTSEKLEGEEALPEDEEQFKKWVENIRTHKSKLYFTMKIRTINIDNIKTALFGWTKGKGHWVDFTTLESVRIFNGGWFHRIHPFYYNRDDFAAYIFNELPDLKDKLDIYQKKSSRRMTKIKKLQRWQ